MINLFVLYNCPDCSEIKSMLLEDAIFDSNFENEYGEKLNLIHFYNEEGSKNTLNKLNFNTTELPILEYNGLIITNKNEIIDFLQQNNLIKLP